MAARSDTGGIFLSDNIWSKDKPENREDPQELIENNGWGESYAQAGGDPVQRKLMNRNFYKHGSLAYDINRYGILPWHKDITYEVGAVAIGSDNKTYRAEVKNTNKDPVINEGTEWKLAQFNAINGSQGNITVTQDAKNNLTINTAVNLENKANKTLDNVTSGDLLGKFQDTATVKWSANNEKVQSTSVIPNDTVTTDMMKNNNVTMPKVSVDIKHRLRNLPALNRPEIFHDVISAIANRSNTQDKIIHIEIPLKLNANSTGYPHLYLFHLFGYGYASKTIIDQKFTGYFFDNSLVNASIHGNLPAAMYLSTDNNLIITIKKYSTYFNPITIHYLDCGLSGNFSMPGRLFTSRYDFAENAHLHAKIKMTSTRLLNQSTTYDTTITVNEY